VLLRTRKKMKRRNPSSKDCHAPHGISRTLRQ
jgi:hypothetical protein